MGFMKSGVSLMALFFLSIIIPSLMRAGDAFLFVGLLIWFYGFFHARNLAACAEEQLQSLPDEWIWESFVSGRNIQISNPVLRKWAAWILILFGIVLLWQNLTYFLYWLIPEDVWTLWAPVVDRIPEIIVALLIIAVGLKMISGKKEELDRDDN